MQNAKRESGLMLMDAVTAMAILGVLLGVVAVALSQQRHAALNLQTHRRMERLAEGVLTDLQRGAAPKVVAWDTDDQPTYAIERLPDPGPCDGWVWIEVAVQQDRYHTTVTGPVPVSSLDQYGIEP